MHCMVVFNPRPLTSNGIQNLNLAALTGDVPLDHRGTVGTTQAFHIDGPYR